MFAPAIEIEFVRFDDPKITPPGFVLDRSPRAVPLWIAALSAPEVDIRREAALTIILAHRQEVEDIESTIPALRKALDDPEQHPAVVAAVARALIALDVRDAAISLAHRAERGGAELAQTIEPALARWDYAPIRKRWLARLNEPQTTRSLLVLAIDGLGAVGDTSAAPRLKVLSAASDREPGIRLAAAKSLAQLQREGLEETATELTSRSGKDGLIDQLVAAKLLRRHASDEALKILASLALDPEPAVASAALERLMEHDFRLVLPLAERLAASGDANVRHAAAKAWIAERTPGAIAHLGPMLDDPHPMVRTDVREALLAMAVEEPLLGPVLEAAKAMLAGNQWRALEQSIMIMAALERDESAERLVELLEFDRPEVYVAAAWGLRLLAVPDTRSAILDKAERLYAIQSAGGANRTQELQSQHLSEAIRVLQADEALPLLRKYIPKNLVIESHSRGAAIWTIGHLLAGRPPDAELVEQMGARIADVTTMPSETAEVREACAVALGRMKAEGGLPTLRRFAGTTPTYDPVAYACQWAIREITGEGDPAFGPPQPQRRQWFLDTVE
jgi:HEAT repeat protein